MKRIIPILLIFAVFAAVISGCGLATKSSANGDDVIVVMKIGNPVMTVNGEEINIDDEGTAPLILNERTLLPVRAVVEAFGGEVSWDGKTQEVTLTRETDKIKLTINSEVAYLNGAANTLDTVPTIINDRTMLPIRFIAEGFGLDVKWNDNTKEVTILSEAISDISLPMETTKENDISTEQTITCVDISFDFTRMSTMASNQYAVWVEDAEGMLVKTITATNFTAARRGYRNRETSLAEWVKAANPETMTDGEIDAVSSATQNSGRLSYSWDLTDENGNRVADGVYKVKVEGTLYWGSSVLYTAELDTLTAAGGELEVTEERTEPVNTENEDMIKNVKITLIGETVKKGNSEMKDNTDNWLGGLEPQTALEYMKEHYGELVIVEVNTDYWKLKTGFIGAMHIPHDEMSERYNEIPSGVPVILHCGAGVVSVDTYEILTEKRPDIPQLSYIAGVPPVSEYNEWVENKSK